MFKYAAANVTAVVLTKYLHQQRFLRAYGESGSIQMAARWSRIHRQTHYDWLRDDPTYAARFREARRQEDEAVRRARYGVSRPVLHQGRQVYVEGWPLYEHQYSDRLSERLLEANDPERYRRRSERVDLKFTGDLASVSDEQLEGAR